MDFTVTSSATPPGTTILLGPSGTVSTTLPTYQWSAVTGADEYYLWVRGPSMTPVVQQWLNAAALCSGGVCSVTPSTALATGSHRWWVQARNATGTGPWSAHMDFTVVP
jgi:hypothetical protein